MRERTGPPGPRVAIGIRTLFDGIAGTVSRLRGTFSDVLRPDVDGEELIEGGHVEFRGGPEPRHPGVVNQDVDRAGLLDQIVYPGALAEISRDEAGLAAVGVDGVGYRCAAGFAAGHDDLGAVPGQLLGRCPSDSRRRPGDQRAQACRSRSSFM